MYTGGVTIGESARLLRERRRASATDRDRGVTLIEVMVAVLMLFVVTGAAAMAMTNGLRTQALTERTDRITGLTQVVMSKAREVDFTQLGYYTADGVTAGNVTVPVSPVTAGAVGPSVTEQRVILGSARPPGTEPFAPAVETITNDSGVNYRVSTAVTWVPNPGGVGAPTAKRVTVTTQWAPYPTSLTGNCAQVNTRCTTNSFVRTATASDLDPVTGTSPTSTCTPGAKVICEAYARAGRVLDGGTMVSATDTPEQVAPVDLYVRTASTATNVKATWTWRDAAGTPTRTVTVPLTGGADGTRWVGEVSPDTAGAASDYKGDIRPGAVEVKFTATIGGATVTTTQPTFWSYGAADGADVVSATVVDADNWCSPVGAAAPVTFAVQGHSIGFTEATQNPSAKDDVQAVFTTTTGGVTRTVTVPASVVPGSVVAEHQSQNGVVTGGWVNAQWTVVPPVTEQCDNRSVSLIVHRAIDQTSTPIILALPSTTAVVPTLDAPVLSVTAPPTSSYSLTWTAPSGATSYILEVTEEGEPAQSITTTALSYTGTLEPGQSVTARVKATTQWSASTWSNTVTTLRAPANPTVTAVRAANQITFSWPAVPFADDYYVYLNDGTQVGMPAVGPQTSRTYTVNSQPGRTVTITVAARADGWASPGGVATASIPMWDALPTANGWVNYDGGYVQGRYSRSAEGVVFLEGLLRAGDTTQGATIGNLPPGYRPAYRMIFGVATNGGFSARVDVLPDGRVIIGGAGQSLSAGWISMASITFPAADAGLAWTNQTPINGWVNYGAPWAPARTAVDGFGRVWVDGLVANGTLTNNTPYFTMPASYLPTEYHHLATNGNDRFSGLGIGGGYHLVAKNYQGGGWTSLVSMWHSPSYTGTWTALGLSNGWLRYGGYTAPSYTKAPDGLVSVRGLIYGGTTTIGTVVAQLPVGYRPSAALAIDVASNGAYARVDIHPDGKIVVAEGTSASWLSLDSISFRADQ